MRIQDNPSDPKADIRLEFTGARLCPFLVPGKALDQATGPNWLHFFFNALFEQPPVDRVRREESKPHSNLHHEPKDGDGFADFTAKDQERGNCHPAIHSDLPRRESQRVSFQRGDQTLPGGEISHGLDREILKSNPEKKCQDEVHRPCTKDFAAKERQWKENHYPFRSNVSENTASAAVGRCNGTHLPEWLFPSRRFLAPLFCFHYSTMRAQTAPFEISPKRQRTKIQCCDRPHDIHNPHVLGVTGEQINDNHNRADPGNCERGNGYEFKPLGKLHI
ncbi:MAG: hypothetical protein JWQ71_765 [Pedosphaera sp.]|nr:hypothetical protein [Pedosphaera sp.]